MARCPRRASLLASRGGSRSTRAGILLTPLHATEQIYDHNVICRPYHIISTSVHIYRLQSGKNISHGDCRRIPHSYIYSREFFYTNVARKLLSKSRKPRENGNTLPTACVGSACSACLGPNFCWCELQVRPSLTAFAESREPTLSRLLRITIPLSILFHVFKSGLSPYLPQARQPKHIVHHHLSATYARL